MSDPRMQTDNRYEPPFQVGAFHIEATFDNVWMVYDAFDNRCWLYFATAPEAVNACIALDAAANETRGRGGAAALDEEYQRQLSKARASLADMR